MQRGGCLELYHCNMVECPGGIQASSARPTSFLEYFDTDKFVVVINLIFSHSTLATYVAI